MKPVKEKKIGGKKKKILVIQKTEKEDKDQVLCKKKKNVCSFKKLAICNCFQEVIYLFRKVSGLYSAWNLRSSLSLFKPEVLYLLREINKASKPSLVLARRQHAYQRRCLRLSRP